MNESQTTIELTEEEIERIIEESVLHPGRSKRRHLRLNANHVIISQSAWNAEEDAGVIPIRR